MSGDHHRPDAVIAARVRDVEALLEQRGLLDSGELDAALEAFLARAHPGQRRTHRGPRVARRRLPRPAC